MAIIVKLGICDTSKENLSCFRCLEKLQHGERHHYWGIQFEKEFVACSFHKTPTKKLVGLTVLYSYGFIDTQTAIGITTIHRVDRRGKILNPASPSYLSLEQIFEFYENPSQELVTKLIDENVHENKYWKNKAEEELRVKDVDTGKDGIRRGARVLGLERYCTECGVSEAEMVAKNPRYTLCRGVCVVCYRRIYRKVSNKPRVQNNS